MVKRGHKQAKHLPRPLKNQSLPPKLKTSTPKLLPKKIWQPEPKPLKEKSMSEPTSKKDAAAPTKEDAHSTADELKAVVQKFIELSQGGAWTEPNQDLRDLVDRAKKALSAAAAQTPAPSSTHTDKP